MTPDTYPEDIRWPGVSGRRKMQTGETNQMTNRLHAERVERLIARMETARPYDRGDGHRMGTWSIFGDDPFLPLPGRVRSSGLQPVSAAHGLTWLVRGKFLRWTYLLFRSEPGRYLVTPHPWLMDAARRMMEVNDAA